MFRVVAHNPLPICYLRRGEWPKRRLLRGGLRPCSRPTVGQVDYFDTKPPSVGLRVAPSGRKTWFIHVSELGGVCGVSRLGPIRC